MKENLIFRYHIDIRNTLLTWAKSVSREVQFGNRLIGKKRLPGLHAENAL